MIFEIQWRYAAHIRKANTLYKPNKTTRMLKLPTSIFLFSKTEMVQVFVGDEREYDAYKGS